MSWPSYAGTRIDSRLTSQPSSSHIPHWLLPIQYTRRASARQLEGLSDRVVVPDAFR